MKHLLSLLGSLTMVGTTAATVGAWTNQAESSTQLEEHVDKKALEEVIQKADTAFKEHPKKTTEARENFIYQIARAKKVFNHKSYVIEQFDTAKADLEKATEEFINSEDSTAPSLEVRAALGEMLGRADELIKTALKQQSTERFAEIINMSRTVYNVEDLDDEMYNATSNELSRAMADFKIDYEIGHYLLNRAFSGTELNVRGHHPDDAIIIMGMKSIMWVENILLDDAEFNDLNLDYRTWFEEDIVLMHGTYANYELEMPIWWMQ